MVSEQDTTILARLTSSVSKSSEGARPRGRERPSHPAQTVNAEAGGCRCGGLRDVGWQALDGKPDLIPQALGSGQYDSGRMISRAQKAAPLHTSCLKDQPTDAGVLTHRRYRAFPHLRGRPFTRLKETSAPNIEFTAGVLGHVNRRALPSS